jgi:hypothetical protein
MSRDTESLLERTPFGVVEPQPFPLFTAGLPAFPMRRIGCVL